MAATFTACSTAVAFASNKSMLSLFNGVGSGRVLRLYRIWALNNQTAGVTGVMTTMEIRRITASTGGTAVTPVKHDTSSASLPAQVLCASGPTDTTSDLFRRIMWSTDEPAVSSGTNDELQCLPALGLLWDAAYGDTNIEPLVLREGQGISIRQPGANTVGIADFMFEFTDAAS